MEFERELNPESITDQDIRNATYNYIRYQDKTGGMNYTEARIVHHAIEKVLKNWDYKTDQ
jgi:hypothetical protein